MGIPKHLYHYTSQKGLLGILGGKTWMTSIFYLNDSLEYSHCLNICKKELETRIQLLLREELGDKTPEREESISEKKFGYYKRVELYVSNIKNHVVDQLFVFSFSQRNDDLSQWRGYCPEVGGYCIEFDAIKLFSSINIVDSWTGQPRRYHKRSHKYDKNKVDSKKKEACLFYNCSYDIEENKVLVKSLFDDIIKRIEVENENPLIGSAETLMKLNVLATYIKDESFKNEKECRLICRRSIQSIKYREGKSMLIPYIEFDLSDINDTLPIRRIIVGPTPHPELSKMSVISLLKSYGYNIEVESSKIPYRPW